MSVPTPALRVFLGIEAVSSLAFALAFTLQALYFIQVAQLTPLQLLLIGTALELTCLLAEVPTGVIADLSSRRLSVILGYAGLGLGLLIVAAFPTFGAILAAQVVSGLGYTLISGAQTAWLADEGGEAALGRSLLLGGQYGRVAALVGIPASAALALLGLRAPILGAALLLLGLAGALALTMPERHFQPTPRDPRGGGGPSAPRWSARSARCTAAACCWACSSRRCCSARAPRRSTACASTTSCATWACAGVGSRCPPHGSSRASRCSGSSWASS